ncbi:MAG: hypothetical protein DLM54_07705 [Acidimicrobiales bacterium]|nr:MAG: hypothetical protein DLM54_07705 [Acidimicrobiales bacterium]
MNPMYRYVTRRVLPSLIGLALLLAGCGSGHSGMASTPGGAPRMSTSGALPGAPTGSGGGAGAGTTPILQSPGDNWPTYHHDLARSGTDPLAPPAGSLVSRWTAHLDGAAVYAEPLVGNGLVVVATEGNDVFAVQGGTGRVRWRTSLGQPVSGGALPCGDIDPSGVTGTPVIDQATGSIWVVAFVKPGHHVLYQVDLASGAIRSQRRVDPAGSTPLVEQQRGALALSQGRVYIPFGGLYGDCGNYHGYVVGAAADGTGPLGVYQVPSQREGAIWAPSGPAVDPVGNLYVATGNGSSSSSYDGGDSVIRLSPALMPTDYFTPSDIAQLNANDADLGSTGPLLVGDGQVFQIGKSGIGYLLDAAHLGGIGHPLYSTPVCQGGAYGADATSGSLVVVPCTTGLVALRLGPGSASVAAEPTFTVAWRGSGHPGAPVVAGGVVWALDTYHGYLYGSDLATGATHGRVHVGQVAHFATPAVSGSSIYVAGSGGLLAFSGA